MVKWLWKTFFQMTEVFILGEGFVFFFFVFKVCPPSKPETVCLDPETIKQISGLSSQIPTGFAQPNFLDLINQLTKSKSLCK